MSTEREDAELAFLEKGEIGFGVHEDGGVYCLRYAWGKIIGRGSTIREALADAILNERSGGVDGPGRESLGDVTEPRSATIKFIDKGPLEPVDWDGEPAPGPEEPKDEKLVAIEEAFRRGYCAAYPVIAEYLRITGVLDELFEPSQAEVDGAWHRQRGYSWVESYLSDQPQPEPADEAPDEIWLQPIEPGFRNWTWCWHEVGECEDADVRYVRADQPESVQDAMEFLTGEEGTPTYTPGAEWSTGEDPTPSEDVVDRLQESVDTGRMAVPKYGPQLVVDAIAEILRLREVVAIWQEREHLQRYFAQRYRKALEEIKDHWPSYDDEQFNPQFEELHKEIKDCSECQDVKARQWPPSGMCNDHYPKHARLMEARDLDQVTRRWADLKAIASEALKGERDA